MGIPLQPRDAFINVDRSVPPSACGGQVDLPTVHSLPSCTGMPRQTRRPPIARRRGAAVSVARAAVAPAQREATHAMVAGIASIENALETCPDENVPKLDNPLTLPRQLPDKFQTIPIQFRQGPQQCPRGCITFALGENLRASEQARASGCGR